MVDFYTNDSVVGVALSGWTSVIILTYILFEYLNWVNTRLFFFRKIFIYFKVRKNIKSIIPSWWNIKSISILTMSKRKGNSNIEVYFKLRYKNKTPIPFGVLSDTLAYRNGKIRTTSVFLLERIDELDSINKINKVQMKRDKILEDLGI